MSQIKKSHKRKSQENQENKFEAKIMHATMVM